MYRLSRKSFWMSELRYAFSNLSCTFSFLNAGKEMSQKLSAVKQIISSRQKLTFEPKSILKKKSCFQMSWKWAENDKREIQKLVGMIWKRYSKQNWWDMLYLRVIPRKSRFYIKSQFWKSFHWGHFLSKDQLVPVAQWAKILSEEGPYSIFLHFYKKFIRFPYFCNMLLQYYCICIIQICENKKASSEIIITYCVYPDTDFWWKSVQRKR